MERLIYILLVCLVLRRVNCVMLKKECPQNEFHRACSFYLEYTCWEASDMMDRVRSSAKKLLHCKAGCFCKKGLVRAFPQGPCISSMYCRDKKLQNFLMQLPTDFTGNL